MAKFNSKYVLSTLLLAGTLIAYYSVIQEFLEFYNIYGTLWKFEDCRIPNPMTTPCFYGAFGFLFALFWSLKKKYNLKFLSIFLLGGTIFAWYNNYSILYNYFVIKNSSLIGCTGKIVSNPFATPCFTGATIFTICFAVSIVFIKFKLSRS